MDSQYLCGHIWFRIRTSDGGEWQFRNLCTMHMYMHELLFFICFFVVVVVLCSQSVYPSHIQFSEQEKMNICYLAFPDSNSGCMGDTQFHIRLRVAPGTRNTLLNTELRRFNKQCVSTLRADLGHYWGFVYFRQIKDPTIPRGYFQKVRWLSDTSVCFEMNKVELWLFICRV